MTTTADPRHVRRLLAGVALASALALLATSRSATGSATPLPDLRVNPNSAPREVLAALPNLGPARLDAIDAARGAVPFRSLVDLERRVKGIGPARAAELAPYLRFDPDPVIRP